MRLLFVHQNFPGQYCHIIQAIMAQGGHRIIGLGINPLSEPLPNGVIYKRYRLQRGNTPGIHLGSSTQKPNASVAKHVQPQQQNSNNRDFIPI